MPKSEHLNVKKKNAQLCWLGLLNLWLPSSKGYSVLPDNLISSLFCYHGMTIVYPLSSQTSTPSLPSPLSAFTSSHHSIILPSTSMPMNSAFSLVTVDQPPLLLFKIDPIPPNFSKNTTPIILFSLSWITDLYFSILSFLSTNKHIIISSIFIKILDSNIPSNSCPAFQHFLKRVAFLSLNFFPFFSDVKLGTINHI